MTPQPWRGALLRRNLLAALTLAALALPEQLATARLAGLPAAQGIAVFAASAAAMVLVSRQRTLSVGADSTIAPVIAVAVAGAAAPGAAALIAVMVGAILILVAAFRLQGIARLLSMPVAAGMMTGIALHILIGRLPTALGLELPPASAVRTLLAAARGIGEAQAAPLIVTALVAAACLAGRAMGPRLPAPLAALAAATAAAALLDPDATHLARSADATLDWNLAPPALQADLALALAPTALTVATLCLFQTTMVLREEAADAPELRRNAFFAVGLSNLAAAAIGGFAVNSSPPRTRILRDVGATTQWAGLGAAAIALATLILAPGLLRAIPSAALAGVLVFVALHILPLDQLRLLARRSRREAAIAFATAGLVALLPLQYGLPAAILLSVLNATLPLFASQVVELRRIPRTTIWWHRVEDDAAEADERMLVLGLASPVNFANVEGVVAEIRAFVAARPHPPRVLVLECAGVLSLDMTGALALSALAGELREAGILVGLARLEADRAREEFERSGLLDAIGRDRIFESVQQAKLALLPPRAQRRRNDARPGR